jgi:hypothetical protein
VRELIELEKGETAREKERDRRLKGNRRRAKDTHI